MTLRIKTLTAFAALSLGAAAWAQDAQDGMAAPALAEQAADAVNAATDVPDAAGAAAEQVMDATTDAAQAATDTEAATAAEDATIEASAAEPAPAEEAAAADAAPAETAVEVTDAQEDAVDGSVAETAGEMESAAEPEVAVADPATEAELAGEEAAEHGTEEDGHGEEEAGSSHAEQHIEDIAFSFEGPFGKFDQFQLQRGLQVYTEVCASCHGLKQVALRTLGDKGGPELPEDQVRAYAAQFDITDPETEEDRPREPTDFFPTVSGEGMGPDLSLMAKARAGFHGPYGTGINQLFRGIGGPEYIHAVLTGYDGEEKEQAGSVLYHNAAFAGNWISMPAPLSDDLVTYEDGTPATADQMAEDVSAFLMWTAEPHMMARKRNGFVTVIFLVGFASLLYLTNKRLWWSVKHGKDS
ncbi:MAG: cytochrome c1 [Paracoccus sp. (in: a-proteobacteria)]